MSKPKTTGWPWLVIRPNGVDEYGVESEAREDAGEGGVVMPRAVALAALDLRHTLAWVVDAQEAIDTGKVADCLERDAAMDAARALLDRTKSPTPAAGKE